MELWYQLVATLLPFVWADHQFMKNALLAVLLVTPLLGLLGTMVVSTRMAFFSDALGHSALTGIALGVLLGIGNPLWAMLGFAFIFAILLTMVKNTHAASTDTIIGVFTSTAVALGIVILSRKGGFNKYSAFLIGDILSITPYEIGMLAILAVLVILVWSWIFNAMLLISIHPSLAASRGIRTRRIELLFTLLMATLVTISIQWIGLLIINSFLVLPAASARNFSKNVRQYHLYSVIISLVAGVGGLILSYYWSTATGATMILVAAATYFLTLLFKTT